MHDNYDLKQEQNNKASILASDKFVDGLLELLSVHLSRGSGALIIRDVHHAIYTISSWMEQKSKSSKRRNLLFFAGFWHRYFFADR